MQTIIKEKKSPLKSLKDLEKEIKEAVLINESISQEIRFVKNKVASSKQFKKNIELKPCFLLEEEYKLLNEYFSLFECNIFGKEKIVSGRIVNKPAASTIKIYTNPSLFYNIEKDKALRFYIQKEMGVIFIVYGHKREDISSILTFWKDLVNRKGLERATQIVKNLNGILAPFPLLMLDREDAYLRSKEREEE